jgi:hypothetical protein
VLEYSVLALIVSATVDITLCSFFDYRRFNYYLIAPIVDHVYKPGPLVCKDLNFVSFRHRIIHNIGELTMCRDIFPSGEGHQTAQ